MKLSTENQNWNSMYKQQKNQENIHEMRLVHAEFTRKRKVHKHGAPPPSSKTIFLLIWPPKLLIKKQYFV